MGRRQWRSAPAVRAALAEASRRFPGRSCVADGTIGDAAHSARRSFHNPDERGVVLAFDLTHDPDRGCDAHRLVREAVERRDPRVLEAISQGRIWTKKRAAEGWRPYRGSNKHHQHAHVSIDRAHEDDTSAWWPVLEHVRVKPPPPIPTPTGDTMRVVYVDGGATALLTSSGRLYELQPGEHHAYRARGIPVDLVTQAEMDTYGRVSERIRLSQ